MSGAHAKKEMVTGEKPATSHWKAPSGESDNKKREESPPLVKSHRSGDKKKKMKKLVYYETDSSSPSTSGSDTPSVTSKHHKHKKFSKIPLHYPRISKRTPLLSVPLGKPPVFDGGEERRVAFKATEEKKEESTSSRLPIDASKLDNEETTLIIKSFRQILKQRRGKDYKPRSKKVCYKCGKPGHFIAKCSLSSDSDRGNDKRGKKKEKKRYYKKKGDDAHVCQEWDSDESTTDSSSDEDAANITVNKGFLFPNVGHKCLMAKDSKKKVKSRASTKYATSRDEDNSSDDEDNLLALFANLNMQQKEKLNELIGSIHEKDELLDSQEDFLIKENKKHVEVKNAYAQEVEKCEKLASELSTCHDIISNLRNENAKLIAKVEKFDVCDDSIASLRNDNASLITKIDKLNALLSSLKIENEKLIAKAKDLNVCNVSISNLRNENVILHAKIDELNTCKPSTSTIEHVTICTRCRDINVDAIHDHIATIKQQNDHIAKLDAKIAEYELENEKFKFACSMLYNGRRPGIKDDIGF
jgi:hypothetical protein